MRAVFILGNQLFHPTIVEKRLGGTKDAQIFMREDRELCVHYKYHKHKIMLFLSAMREYAEELRKAGFEVHYEKFGEHPGTYDESLLAFLKRTKPTSLSGFEIEDKFFETRLQEVANVAGLELETWRTPMFLTSRARFEQYLDKSRRPFMKTFYEQQRRRLRVLMTKDDEPVGGRWSFDEDNRLPLPKGYIPPKLAKIEMSAITRDVAELVDREFGDHPGQSAEFWLPTTRAGARAWLDLFLRTRFRDFGPFEDAMTKTSAFVHHSVLTPFLNTGLLTPYEVIKKALSFARAEDIPINSVEGFVRQIIGWREFVRGIYQNYSEVQERENFWKHERKLTSAWYDGTTGIEPLDAMIQKVNRYAYAHHIERLMVAGNLMLLMQIHPHEAHRWFMEMFMDSSDWVMGPNVYGMGIFSDGGIFATKPYICGSNYYRKMGAGKTGDWQIGVDGLYWTFIDTHRAFFTKNPRLSMMVRSYDKMTPEKKSRLKEAADEMRGRLTQT